MQRVSLAYHDLHTVPGRLDVLIFRNLKAALLRCWLLRRGEGPLVVRDCGSGLLLQVGGVGPPQRAVLGHQDGREAAARRVTHSGLCWLQVREKHGA